MFESVKLINIIKNNCEMLLLLAISWRHRPDDVICGNVRQIVEFELLEYQSGVGAMEAWSLRKIGSISATWLVNYNLQCRTRISKPSAQLLRGIRRGTQREILSKRGRTTCGELHNEESSNLCLIIRLSSLNCFATLCFHSRWSVISPSETRDSSLLFSSLSLSLLLSCEICERSSQFSTEKHAIISI